MRNQRDADLPARRAYALGSARGLPRPGRPARARPQGTRFQRVSIAVSRSSGCTPPCGTSGTLIYLHGVPTPWAAPGGYRGLAAQLARPVVRVQLPIPASPDDPRPSLALLEISARPTASGRKLRFGGLLYVGLRALPPAGRPVVRVQLPIPASPDDPRPSLALLEISARPTASPGQSDCGPYSAAPSNRRSTVGGVWCRRRPTGYPDPGFSSPVVLRRAAHRAAARCLASLIVARIPRRRRIGDRQLAACGVDGGQLGIPSSHAGQVARVAAGPPLPGRIRHRLLARRPFRPPTFNPVDGAMVGVAKADRHQLLEPRWASCPGSSGAPVAGQDPTPFVGPPPVPAANPAGTPAPAAPASIPALPPVPPVPPMPPTRASQW